MSKMTPKEMAKQIGGGLLSFPVTPFKPGYSFDEATYRANMDWLCGYDVAGLFAAGGTGEFFSLTPTEVPQVVAVAVNETRGRVPVLAGTGYGTAIAREIAIGAEKAGADGLLRIARRDFLQQQLLRKLFRKTYRLEGSKKRRPGVRHYIVETGADPLQAVWDLNRCGDRGISFLHCFSGLISRIGRERLRGGPDDWR